MTDTGQAAKRIAAYLDADTRLSEYRREHIHSVSVGHGSRYNLTATDLRTVLAENQQMREGDARARSLLALLCDASQCVIDPQGWCAWHHTAPCPHKEAEAFLLGDWQPADKDTH